MWVTLLGIVTLVRREQPSNAPFSILVTLLGIVTLVRLEQEENARLPMLVTLMPIVTLVRAGFFSGFCRTHRFLCGSTNQVHVIASPD